MLDGLGPVLAVDLDRSAKGVQLMQDIALPSDYGEYEVFSFDGKKLLRTFKPLLWSSFILLYIILLAQPAIAASNTTLFEGSIGKYPIVLWYSACEPKPNVRCNAAIGQYRYESRPKLRLVLERQSGSMEFDAAFAEMCVQ